VSVNIRQTIAGPDDFSVASFQWDPGGTSGQLPRQITFGVDAQCAEGDFFEVTVYQTQSTPATAECKLDGFWIHKISSGPTGPTGATGATGSGGGESCSCIPYTYDDSSTADSDPGAGNLRFDNAAPTAATFIYIDDLDGDGVDRTDLFTAWTSGVGTVISGVLTVADAANPENFVMFGILAPVDDTGYTKLPLWFLMGNGGTVAAGDVIVSFDYLQGGYAAYPTDDDPDDDLQGVIEGFLWHDTASDELKMRNANDNGWVTVGPAGPTLTVPTVQFGTEFSSTGVPTATLPADVAQNDILVVALQTANDSNVAAPAGYTQLGPQTGVGAAAAAGSTKQALFWKRAGSSESAPTLTDTGDHTYGVMFRVRGCPTTGDPFCLCGQAQKRVASTTGTSEQGRTPADNTLVMDVFAQAIDSASAQGSSPTNADLSSVTEQFDGGTADGTGGGLYVMTGVKAEAGMVGASTVTWGSSTLDVSTRIVWIPVGVTDATIPMAMPPQVQTFFGTPADLDDTWVKPTGARRVFAQILDGGGGGSGGRSAATAAGGGGGGGGGYDEAWFDADDLGATATVHAGRGGAGGNADGAGNVGVVSEFDKGGSGPLTSLRRVAGTAATAAATADGGNGGCGSGRGTSSPAVVTTRRTLNDGNAARASGGGGAPGGSGTTAPTGGSQGDWGGGGGESGGDTDASITAANNGSSMRGAGGGGGGRTNTNVGQGGNGGGVASAGATQGAAGADSTRLPYGGAGGNGGGSSVAAGGTGGFPGGGGGGGGGVASGTGGAGAPGCVVVITYF
jgi:hypothetical protein